jgi:formylglycine-generating enzyme required for sulfatase activity
MRPANLRSPFCLTTLAFGTGSDTEATLSEFPPTAIRMQRVCVPQLLAHLALALVATNALAQTRTMNVRGSAATGLSVAFEHRAPTSAAGSLALHALTPHYTGVFPLQIPGLTIAGTAQIDAAQVWLQSFSLLSAAGSSEWSVAIPFQPIFVGVAFDVQSLDLDSATSTIHWAQSDAELTIASFAPPLQFQMVAIQPGTFSMGSNVIGGVSAPLHGVTITRPFWVGKYEVTQAEYQAVMGNNPSYWQAAQRPVEQVSWNSAMTYCATLTATEAAAGRIPAGYQYRLPTEAEWEYVCRAGTTTEWNTGASLVCAQANFQGCVPGQTTVVGSYPVNPWGLFDTHGNVWEWCLDSWDVSANYASSAVSDPYVSSGPVRVGRGGSWLSSAVNCRSAIRFYYFPDNTFSFIGFRVVLAPVLVP